MCSGGFGQIICDGTTAKICDGKGGVASQKTCDQGSSCQPGLGCVACKPNTGECHDHMATRCDASGNQSAPFFCDENQGLSCIENQGCIGPCSPSSLAAQGGNEGCDFWPTVTANPVWSDLTHITMNGGFRFGVLVGNVSKETATLTVTANGNAAQSPALNSAGSLSLEAGAAKYIPLSWIPELKGPDWATGQKVAFTPVALAQSVQKRSGAYHLISNQPIIAYQFSPIEATIGDNGNGACPTAPENATPGCYSYSTDASLLIPSHRLGTDYVVTSYRASRQASPSSALPNVGDFLAITASQANTTVKITPRPGQSILPGVDGVHTDGTPFMLNMGVGDVIQLFTPGTSDRDSFSGTLVQEVSGQSHPLQLLTGLGCGAVPAGSYPCGHLEDLVLPRTLLGNEYVVPAFYMQYTVGNQVGPMPYTLRIQAISNGTDLTFEPASMYKNVTLSSGEVLEINNGTLDARISSSTPFAVTQYLNGGSPKADQGGPNQLALFPRNQYQTSYRFVVPDTSLLPDTMQVGSANFTNVVAILAPTGAMITLDGQPLRPDQLLPIGASGMSVSRQTLNGNNKVHEVHADRPFGIVVYGAANYTTYLYSGG